MQQQKQQEGFPVLIKESLPHKEKKKKRRGRGAVGGRPYFTGKAGKVPARLEGEESDIKGEKLSKRIRLRVLK